jgi:Protein of unknown function (DUF3179)
MNGLRYFNYLLIFGAAVLVACSGAAPGPDNFIPPIQQFDGVIQDEFEGESVVLYGSSRLHLFVAYSRTSESGKTLDFHLSDKQFPVVFEDNEGTLWNIFGEAVSGPGDGDRLKLIPYQVGFWFSFSSFFPKVTMYDEPQNERINNDFSSSEWLIDPNDIVQAAIRDAIPSINSPEFELIDLFDENNDPYSNSELMIVINDNAGARVYPHAILNWHEVVNDSFDDEKFVVSLCPLTGTSVAWKDNVTSSPGLGFGVSGLLYNNNLILYDRTTESLWSQITGQSINGPLKDNLVTYANSITMSWRAVKELGMETRVLTVNTGFTRSYNVYPYGDYKTSTNLLFAPTYEDERLHRKAWVMALVVGDKAKVYQFEDFSN